MSTQSHLTEKDWNQLRTAFSVSIMAETPISSLAQNAELGDWPIPGSDEKPSKYLDYSWNELHQIPGLRDKPERIQLLLRVLKETLAFDEPFQEMVKQSEKATETDYAAVKTLNKLGIPEDFPIALTSLSSEAKDFCKSQGFRNLGEFTRMSQRISQLIIMEGDFRAFLNALSHLDEKTICKYLPFRPGEKGLHLAEGIGHALRKYPEAELFACARAFGAKLSPDQTQKAEAVSKGRIAELEQQFRDDLIALLGWFKDDAKDWRTRTGGVHSLEYRLRVLHDPILERVAVNLTRQFFEGGALRKDAPAPVDSGSSTEKKPWWKRLFGG